MSGRCAGLSYNAWCWLMPTRIVEELIDQKMLKPCSNHPNKLVLTRRAADLEGRWLEGTNNITTEKTKEETSDG